MKRATEYIDFKRRTHCFYLILLHYLNESNDFFNSNYTIFFTSYLIKFFLLSLN